MYRVFGIGPIETEQGEGHVLTLMRGELAVGVETAATALEALRTIVDQVGASNVSAGPELRDEARALGVAVAPLSQPMCGFRACQALMVGNGTCIPAEIGAGALSLLSLLAGYVEAAPWRWLDSDTPVQVHLQRGGRRPKQLEASILGNGGEVYGLALYDHPGSIAKLSLPGARPTTHDVVLLTLDDEPDWGVEAMRAGFGVPFFPALARIRHNQVGPLRADDLLCLEAVLWAAAQLEPDKPMVEGAVADEDGSETVIRVEIADPAPTRAAPIKVPRNASCPCGSGRKYKRCCLPKHEAQALRASHDAAQQEQPEQAGDITDEVGAFMKREEPEHDARWLEQLIGSMFPPADLFSILATMLLYELPLKSGEMVAQRFLDRRGRRLGSADRHWLESSLATSTSIWEVLRVVPGEGVELVDMLTGERCFAHDVSLSRGVELRAGILARVVEHRGRRELDGLYPRPLTPRATDEVVKAVRRRLGVRKKWVAREQLRDPAACTALFELWHGKVTAELDRPKQPVELVNTDDDPFEQVCDSYELIEDHEQVLAALLELAGAIDHGVDDEGTHRIGVVREGNPIHRAWQLTSVGELELRGPTLRLRTNSRARADALRASVDARLGLFARFLGREIEAAAPIFRANGGRVAIDSQLLSGWISPPPKAAQELQLRFWRHEPNPALDGQTPCEAVTRAASRRKLHAALRELEHGLDEDGRLAFVDLRRELGLDELGERARVTNAIRMAPKISARLFEFAMPLLMHSQDHVEGEAIMRVAAEVWNHVGELGPRATKRPKLRANARRALAEHGLRVDAPRLNGWIDTLIPLRPMFDDPRFMEINSIEYDDGVFNCRVAALLPK